MPGVWDSPDITLVVVYICMDASATQFNRIPVFPTLIPVECHTEPHLSRIFISQQKLYSNWVVDLDFNQPCFVL